MNVSESTTFQSDHGVAVILSAAVAFAPGIKVTDERDGDVLAISAKGDDRRNEEHLLWQQMLADLESLPLPPWFKNVTRPRPR